MRAAALVIGLPLVVVTACGSSSPSVASKPDRAAPRAQPVKFLPHGVRPLAQGALPRGDRFTIFSGHYRFQGAIYLDLHIETRSGAAGSFRPAQAPGPIAFSRFGECSHPALSIVIGLLRATRDSATLSSQGTARPLTRVALPPGLHAGGVLVYGLAYTSATLSVKSPAGRVAESVALPSFRTACSRTHGVVAAVVQAQTHP